MSTSAGILSNDDTEECGPAGGALVWVLAVTFENFSSIIHLVSYHYGLFHNMTSFF
jgi:hypothetical protein